MCVCVSIGPATLTSQTPLIGPMLVGETPMNLHETYHSITVNNDYPPVIAHSYGKSPFATARSMEKILELDGRCSVYLYIKVPKGIRIT